MTLNKEILNIATYEAIHWWRRDEYFYHKIFSRIPEFKLNVDDLNYFTNFFLKQFARQYSVHRTIKNPNYSKLLDRLLKNGYIDSVINGEVTAIDSIIDVLPPEWFHGRPVSFLSKFAFLINPLDFSLYDSITRNALNSTALKIVGEKNIGRNYSDFIKRVNTISENNFEQLASQISILDEVQAGNDISFLRENPKIFQRRILDKYLWVIGQDQNKVRFQKSLESQNRLWGYYF